MLFFHTPICFDRSRITITIFKLDLFWNTHIEKDNKLMEITAEVPSTTASTKTIRGWEQRQLYYFIWTHSKVTGSRHQVEKQKAASETLKSQVTKIHRLLSEWNTRRARTTYTVSSVFTTVTVSCHQELHLHKRKNCCGTIILMTTRSSDNEEYYI